jgi:hypothetical protein
METYNDDKSSGFLMLVGEVQYNEYRKALMSLLNEF